MIKTFTDLEIYKEAIELAKSVSEQIKFIPKDERDLIGQIRRCSRSIPSQIAEGYGRKYSEKEFKKYLNNSAAECNEMITHVTVVQMERYWKPEFCKNFLDRYIILGKRIANTAKVWQNF